jgi:hypothetical protein
VSSHEALTSSVLRRQGEQGSGGDLIGDNRALPNEFVDGQGFAIRNRSLTPDSHLCGAANMRFFVAATLLLIACAFQVKTILVFSQMMKEVNDALPSDAQIPQVGPSWLRGKVINLHRRFFPASSLRRNLYTLLGIEMAAFVSALACVIRFR